MTMVVVVLFYGGRLARRDLLVESERLRQSHLFGHFFVGRGVHETGEAVLKERSNSWG